MTIIMIDPGHGGARIGGGAGLDVGATAAGYREADVALAHADQLASTLSARPGTVVRLTRTGPSATLRLRDRVRAATDAGAQAFISVHGNASGNPDARGAQVFHARGSVRGEALARAIARAAEPVTGSAVRVFPDQSAACGNRRLYVLRRTPMPAVLVELGFLTNADERALLLDPAYRARLSGAIAAGIGAWLDAEGARS